MMLYLTNYHLMFLPLLRFHFPEKFAEEEKVDDVTPMPSNPVRKVANIISLE